MVTFYKKFNWSGAEIMKVPALLKIAKRWHFGDMSQAIRKGPLVV